MVERKKINKNELDKTSISSLNLGIENPDEEITNADIKLIFVEDGIFTRQRKYLTSFKICGIILTIIKK